MNKLLFGIVLISLTLGCGSPQKEDQQNAEQMDSWFWTAEWHSSNHQIAVGGTQDTLRIFSTKNNQWIKNYPYPGTITKAKWHPTKNKLAVSVQDRLSNPSIIDLDNNAIIELDSISPDGARAIGWNDGGNLLAAGDYDGSLVFFDEDGQFIKKISTGQKSIIGLDWHPSENLLAAIGESIAIYHFDRDSLTTIKDRDEEVEVLMLCVDWHPSGEFFVTGDYGDFQYHYPPLLQYWNSDGQRIKSIQRSKAEYRNLEWSPDGELLATASEKIRLWDQNGKLVSEETTEDLLWGVDWNNVGSQLVTTDQKGNITIWDKRLEKIITLKY